MNRLLAKKIKQETPSFNRDIVSGYSYEQAKRSMNYLHEFISSNMPIVSSTGLEYLGLSRATPEEEFVELTKSRGNKKGSFNLARTDSYMVWITFRFEGEIIRKMFAVPHVRPGGLLQQFGTTYYIAPVLADKIISVTPPEVFIRLMSVRLRFTTVPYHFFANDKKLNYVVLKSEIYKIKNVRKENEDRRFANITPMVLYLLCQYGLKGMFKEMLGVDVHYGYQETINHENYPSDRYVICHTAMTDRYGSDKIQDIRLVIDRSSFDRDEVRCVISGLYFILDQFMGELQPEYLEEKDVWCVCLGKIIFGRHINSGKLLDDTLDHLSSVNDYMDNIMIQKFKAIGMNIETIYQLFMYLIEDFNHLQVQYVDKENCLYDKELSLIYYLMGDITQEIVHMFYKLKKKFKKGRITLGEVKDIILIRTKTLAINNISKSHGEAIVLNYPGDNLIWGMTNQLVPQDKTNKKKNTKGGISYNNPIYKLNASFAEVRTYQSITKPAPDGSTRINPYLIVHPNGSLGRHQHLVPVFDYTQKLFKQ